MRKKVSHYFIVINLLLITILGSTSCSTWDTPLSDFYDPFLSEEALSSIEKEAFLKKTEEPIIYYTDDIISEFNFLESNYFYCIGDSNFNGVAEGQNEIESELKEIAISKGAKIVIYDINYTNTINNIYSNSYGVYSTNIKRYDYNVYYFIGTPNVIIQSNPLGFTAMDLSQNQREQYKRNTGILITTIWDKTPAFYANLALNDIIVGINGTAIIDKDSYYKSLAQIEENTPILIEYIRNGVLQETTLFF
jgi:hypothetical protein